MLVFRMQKHILDAQLGDVIRTNISDFIHIFCLSEIIPEVNKIGIIGFTIDTHTHPLYGGCFGQCVCLCVSVCGCIYLGKAGNGVQLYPSMRLVERPPMSN